ncbi:DNA-directed RNA polymerase I subunit RPA43 [Athalia rosae]|uniref:DNA-directed RNA polymerase I subunit RPA43 n=1 Tax=Athalia rosae TaxID=37344 RepID=UPI002033D58F|nr:DNA-directed RNA polymerase I subunit RPA43 [Athalia rosae]XP_012267257.2 DNA-directed RNA polymerase I subunit RPA43 [Athalia rosae]
MGCKMTGIITWTQLELKELLEDEESHVHYERSRRHLGLHPFHLTDLNSALREILSATINSYDAKLNGIIIAYKNPKLLSRMGSILHDTCYIHIDVEVDFYVFRPNVGDSLKGIVNKKSQDHIGILVHKAFNVSILRPDGDENWLGNSIQIGQEIRFTITYLDIKDKLPYIRGSLDSQDYLRGCRLFTSTIQKTDNTDVKPKNKKLFFASDDEAEQDKSSKDTSFDNTSVQVEENDVDDKVLLKKLKKLKRENSEDESHIKKKKKLRVKAESPPLEDDRILTKKKKKKNVKSELVCSENGTEKEDDSISAGETLPIKLKKVKKEVLDENVRSKPKKKKKTKDETSSQETDFEVSDTVKHRNIKNESDDVRSWKKRKIKVEALSSDAESDIHIVKQRKQKKDDSSDERSMMKAKIKAEVMSSDTESIVNQERLIVNTKKQTSDEENRKKRKLKVETVSPIR